MIISIMEYYSPYVEYLGSDSTGLGRWSWVKLKGNNNLRKVIILAYMPCKPRKKIMFSNYAKQEQYWRMQGIDTCAEKCREDLIESMLECKSRGERVILMIDGN